MKKLNEKNLKTSEWKSAGPEAIAKVKARNESMRVAKEAKDAKLHTRLSETDLQMLKDRAAEKGMGYNTLLGSIVHMYVTDQLVDIKEAKKLLGLNMEFPKKKTS